MHQVISKSKHITRLNKEMRYARFLQFDVKVDNFTVFSGLQLHLYVVFLLCHLLGHLHPKTAFLYVYKMMVGVIGPTNHKIQHKRKCSMIYDTILDIFFIFQKNIEVSAVQILIISCFHLSPPFSVNCIWNLDYIQVQFLVRIFHRWCCFLLSEDA